ncbi:3'-5' exonuclease domain [Macleaya cordata]|uniref:3'-5' exonuclease domain n=1 Tax=Macleaya cordata TaxID=56857 RepID=A0A200QLE7_MACCD|nr:3'-5' exonuclease domain [Macleaya cordata]
MSIGIEDYDYFSSDIQQGYSVKFYDDQVTTIVTENASAVDDWISRIYRDFNSILNHLIVGLDIEWRPTFNRNTRYKVAILQLCVGRRCLIIQLLYADYIPRSLVQFLGNPSFTFVGVGIDDDVQKLVADYGLEVANTADLRISAANRFNMKQLKNAGLKTLAEMVLGEEIEKPRRITTSNWSVDYLNDDQILYACLDAYVSFKIGRVLMSPF